MELLDLLFGVLLAVLGIVVAELIIDRLRDCRERRKLIREKKTLLLSLINEVANNLDILRENLKRSKEGRRDEYILFRVDVYTRLRQSLTPELVTEFKTELFMSLSVGYLFCEEFNRRVAIDPDSVRFIEENYFKTIKKNLEYFDKNYEMKNSE